METLAFPLLVAMQPTYTQQYLCGECIHGTIRPRLLGNQHSPAHCWLPCNSTIPSGERIHGTIRPRIPSNDAFGRTRHNIFKRCLLSLCLDSVLHFGDETANSLCSSTFTSRPTSLLASVSFLIVSTLSPSKVMSSHVPPSARSVRRMLVTANVVPNSPILVTLMMEAQSLS
jgi:hypothetical protein